MGELLDLVFYNPTRLKEDDFLRGFVARRGLADKVLARLGDIKPRGVARHRLLTGQRGMGKTTLLRRIAIGVRDDPALAALLIPLSFREEQYNVHDLHTFWCNCLDALGDWFEAVGQQEKAVRVDQDLRFLAMRSGGQEEETALEVFQQWMKREGKRALLLLDNIDLIFDGLREHQWSLRRVLQKAGGIVVVGTSSVFLESTVRPDAPFYEFFRVDVLEKLEHAELVSCLRGLAAERGEKGKKVVRLLDQDPARIRALYDLTGGNPRTLAMLYLVLEMRDDGELMQDLERLLDQATPLYKARVEELAPQTRVMFDAVALIWNPASAADVAAATGLEVGTVSSQLDRLFKNGLVEKVGLSGTSRTGFQVVERFFNIWYLMRHAPRRQRSRLRWLTEFLRQFYTPRELADLAYAQMHGPQPDAQSSAQWYLAMAEAVASPAQSQALRHHATRVLEDYCRQEHKKLSDLMDLTDLHGPTHTMAELKQQTLACARDWVGIDPSAFWDRLGGSVNLMAPQKAGIVGQLPELESAVLRAVDGLLSQEQRDELARWGHATGVEGLRRALREGLMESPVDFRGALGAASRYGIPGLLPIAAGFARDSIRLESGVETEELGRHLDVLLRPDPVGQTQGTSAFWTNMGNLLAMHLGRYEEAAAVFRKACELDPKQAVPWYNLGNLLCQQLGRHEEADTAYRKAAELDPNYAYPWNNLGNVLSQLGRREEAEASYRKAAELDPKAALPWSNLGSLLAQHTGRYDEAEAAFRKATDLDPNDVVPRNELGVLLSRHLGRYDEAEAAFREAIELDRNEAIPWNNLGGLLADHRGKLEEAEAAHRRALHLDKGNVLLMANLAYLLLPQRGRAEEAEELCRKAVAELPATGASLLKAFHALALDNFGEATTELGKVLEEGSDRLFQDFYDDLLRVLRLAADRGFGETLLIWFKQSGLGDRYWPFQAAFDAYVHGEARLLDVNPEVRGAARRIFEWLSSRSRRQVQR